MTKIVPRGVRNNNPLNIRIGDDWQGLDEPSSDGTFCRFQALQWGFRAAFLILNNYYNRHGLHTIHKIINRWAPASENNTDVYEATVVKYVKKYFGRPVGACVELPPVCSDSKMWCAIVRAMTLMECGQDFAQKASTPGHILQGYCLAVVQK